LHRDTGKDRIDRHNWKIPDKLEGIVDAHLLRPCYDDVSWLKVSQTHECWLRHLQHNALHTLGQLLHFLCFSLNASIQTLPLLKLAFEASDFLKIEAFRKRFVSALR